jgi:hypothetical protein
MALADLFNVPLTDADMATWSFNHMAHHRELNATILREKNIALPEYILDPVNPADPEGFLYQHQQMHNNTDAIYGISGFDLTDVDWLDPDNRAGWIWLNATLHVAEADATETF